jgi:hypothetical protein
VCFRGESGNLGIYYQFAVDNFTVTAYGYQKNEFAPDVPLNLFQSEKGLGLEMVPTHQINEKTYVQFDLSLLLSDPSVKNAWITLAGCGEYQLRGSMTLGQTGQRIQHGCVEEETEIHMTHYGKWKYVAVTTDDCDALLSIVKFCIEREPRPAYSYEYTVTHQDVAAGAPILFENWKGDGFTQPNPATVQAVVKGVYQDNWTANATAPNSFALYVNGLIVPGSVHGSTGFTQGQGVLSLNAGDIIQVVNQGATVSLSALNVGDTIASFTLTRIAL